MLTEMYSMLMTGRLFSLIATSFIFILGTASTEAHSVEAKAYVTEINQQSNTPDYYSIAEAGVKKYYPQYEPYFKEIIKEIKCLGNYGEYLLNKEIAKKLILSGEGLNEKEIITSILISFENITAKESFKSGISITKNNKEYKIGTEIAESFYERYMAENKKIESFEKEIKALNDKYESKNINEIENEYIEISEKYMQLLKNWLLNYGELRRTKGAQNWIKGYIEMIKRNNRTPSKIGQRYIDEYNKINKK